MKPVTLLLVVLAGICLILFASMISLPDIVLDVAGVLIISWGLWKLYEIKNG